METKSKNGWRSKIAFFLFFAVIYVIYFSFGFYHLTEFVTVDEHKWTDQRITQYWKGMRDHKWRFTEINDKPGVSLAIVAGIKYAVVKPLVFKKAELFYKHLTIDQKKNFLFSQRLPLLICNSLLALYCFWAIKKITRDKWIAAWSSALILLCPVLIGISQIINPDALLWSLGAAAILSYAAFLKSQEKKFIIFTPIFLGLALLSKYTAVVLMPFLFIANILFYIACPEDWNVEKKTRRILIKTSIAFFASAAGSLLVFTLLMPAVFSNFQILLRGTIGYSSIKYFLFVCLALQLIILLEAALFKGRHILLLRLKTEKFFAVLTRIIYFLLFLTFLFVLINWISGEKLINLSRIPFDARKEDLFTQGTALYEKIILEFYPLVFSLTPLVLFFVMFLWFKGFIKKIGHNFLVLTVSCFIIIFLAALIYEGLLTNIRYSIMLYPLISVLAAVGIREFFSAKKLLGVNKYFISVLIIAFSFISLWLIKPFYLSYANDLLPKKYAIANSWGYGGYEAAQFLNSLPDAVLTFIWSNYAGVKDFYRGICLTTHDNPGNYTIAYYVLIHRRQYETQKIPNSPKEINFYNAYKLFKNSQPIWELNIDGRPGNFIRIYKAEN